MNDAIELHDSKMASVSFSDGQAIVLFSSAYVHRSTGRPGWDAGSGWMQPATLTFDGASPGPLPAHLPAAVSEGFLRVGDVLHDNLIPASGTYEEIIELSVVLKDAGRLIIRGQRLRIELHGEPRYVEEFPPPPADS